MNFAVVLSENHPSLLEDVLRQAGYCSPVIVNQNSILIDGYRRFRAIPEIEVIRMKVDSVYSAAATLNRNTRRWDEIDRFLWARWAESLEVPADPYSDELRKAPLDLLQALANRKLQLGQAIRILAGPSACWPFFVEILSGRITLNVNETAALIDMTFDLAARSNTKNVAEVFSHPELNSILIDPARNPKQRGDALLKAMRRLRYPLYQQKTEETAAAWKELKLDQLQGNQNLFLTRGVLEITIRARSHDEMSAKVRGLFETMHSPSWSKLWSE